MRYPRRRPPRRGRPHQTGARRDRTRRARAHDLHDELGQALDADRDRPLPACTRRRPVSTRKGMVDSNYFIRGYAIHGYAEVPTYAASHGCLRVPIPDAAAIYRVGADGHAGRRLQRGRRRQRQRPAVDAARTHGPLSRPALDATRRTIAREEAEAEAVDEQREQQLDAADDPFAARRRDEARERRGELVGGFVDRLVQRALVLGGARRPCGRRPGWRGPEAAICSCWWAGGRLFVWSTTKTTNEAITITQMTRCDAA